MTYYSISCDKCEAEVLYSPESHPRDFYFTVEEGNGVFRTETRMLCRACEIEILNLIDGDGGNEDKVDLPYRVRSGIMLRRTAERLEDLADKFDD